MKKIEIDENVQGEGRVNIFAYFIKLCRKKIIWNALYAPPSHIFRTSHIFRSIYIFLVVISILFSISSKGFGIENNVEDPAIKLKKEQMELENKKRVIEHVENTRKVLPELMKKLKLEKDADKRKEIIYKIGQAEDPGTIDPLLEIAEDEKEDKRVKISAVNSLYIISSSRWLRNNELENKIKDKIIPSLKKIYEKNNEENNKYLSSYLYVLGEKDLAEPILLKRLKEGDNAVFCYFYYYNKIGEILILSTYYDVNETKKVDQRAEKILKEALSNEYPERIRIESAHTLIKYFDEKELTYYTLVDIIKNSKEKGYRILALGELKYIGDERSKKIVLDSQNDHEIGETAKEILMFEWGKNE